MRARLARPTRVPAGGSSMTAVTPRSAKRSVHRSQRTGFDDLGDEPVEDLASAGDDLAVAVGDQRDRGVGGGEVGGRGGEGVDGGLHVAGVEGAGDLERDDPGPGGGILGEGGEGLEGAGGDDLAGAVDVGRGEAVPLDGGEHVGGVAAEDRAHAGGGGGAGLGHAAAAHGRPGASRRPRPGRRRRRRR